MEHMGQFSFKSKADREDFYQSKFDYYFKFNFWIVVAGVLASCTYFVSDCLIFKRFETQTLLPRFFALIPLIPFILISKRIKNYKANVILSYLMIHIIIWDTIWAISFFPDKSHANDAFLIMQLLFFALGFASPFTIACIFHIGIFADILISNIFMNYGNLNMILSLGIPATVGIIIAHFCIQYYYLDHYRTVKNLEHISKYDQLTETYNRYRINEITDSEHVAFKKEYGRNICLIMIDVDLFKNVNDKYGHIAGDKVLQKICQRIRENIPDDADFIRWGGEEFIIVLPNTTIDLGIIISEKLVKAVASMETGICPVTISAGLADYDGKSYKQAIDSADKALYLAKSSGRNCVKYSFSNV